MNSLGYGRPKSGGQLPRVGTHGQFLAELEGMPAPRGPETPGLRTFILESDGSFPERAKLEGVSYEAADSGLDGIKILRVTDGDLTHESYLDVRDGRFMLMHACCGLGAVAKFIDALFEDRDHVIDYAWLAGMHGAQDGVVPPGRAGGGYHGGYVAKRESAQDHLEAVKYCVDEYSRILRDVEREFVGMVEEDGMRFLAGNAFYFSLPNPMDPQELIEKIFDCERPFSLFGIKQKIRDGYYHVLAVDLRAGRPMDFEIADDMMRAYAFTGSCAGTLMRLLACLRLRIDSGIACPMLDEIMRR